MTRETIAKQIAEELLDMGTLDLHNYNGDADAVLEYTQAIILKYLKDYMIISGNLL